MKRKNLILLMGIYCAFVGCTNMFVPPKGTNEKIEGNRDKEVAQIEVATEATVEKNQEIGVITITFRSKKSIISSTFHEELNTLIGNVNKPEFLHKKIIISGFTDSDEDSDLELRFLSIERAREVQKFLIEKVIFPERIYIEGHQNRYLNSNSSVMEKAENRRVEIKISSK